MLHWLLHTFQFLSLRDFMGCSKVCKEWYTTANQRYLTDLSPLSAEDLTLYPKKRLSTITTLEILPSSTLPTSPAACTELTRLGAILTRVLPYLDNLQKLNLQGSYLPVKFVKLLAADVTLLPYLQHLDLSELKLPMNFCYFQQLAQTRHGGTNPFNLLFSGTKFKSISSVVDSQISFVNTYSKAVKVEWLDFTGMRVTYISLNPGASYTQATYKNHPWVVVDGENPYRIFMRTVGMKFPQVVNTTKTLPNGIPIPQPLEPVTMDRPNNVVVTNKTTFTLSLSSPFPHPLPPPSSALMTPDLVLQPAQSCTLHSFCTVPWVIKCHEPTQAQQTQTRGAHASQGAQELRMIITTLSLPLEVRTTVRRNGQKKLVLWLVKN